MRKQEKETGKTQNCSPKNSSEERYTEDEQLELDELINIQGGVEGPVDKQQYCGLGCYVGGLTAEGTDNSLKDAKE